MALLCVGAMGSDPGNVESTSWKKGPLMEVAADGSVKAPDEKSWAMQPVGHPAFATLSVRQRPVKEGDARWTVSGTLVSTNAGGPVPERAVYVVYDNGVWHLAAMSNLKGEVLFEAFASRDREGKLLKPTHLYVGGHVSGVPRPQTGALLRQYRFTATE